MFWEGSPPPNLAVVELLTRMHVVLCINRWSPGWNVVLSSPQTLQEL